MLKKIVLGSLLLGLCGILVVGAIQRTTSRLERGTNSSGEGSQGRQTETAGVSGQRNAGSQAGRNQAVDTNVQLGQGNQGNRAGNGSADEVTESLQVFAEVVAVDGDALVVETTDGDEVVIEGRSWRFANDMGFQVQVGDRIGMSGFYEDGEWKTTEIENLSNGTSLILRADSGRPMWAGQGQQGL